MQRFYQRKPTPMPPKRSTDALAGSSRANPSHQRWSRPPGKV
jgi:hypothetical protein